MALNHAVLEAAARWHVELHCDPSDETVREAHRRWLDADPGHRLAWERLGRLQERFGQIEPGIGRATLHSAYLKRREVMKVLSLLIAAGATGTATWKLAPLPSLTADLRTATGERKTLELEDGSQLQLNTATAINVRYSATLRELQVVRGEILVETARDPSGRPFIVHTPEGSVRALGTRFLVRSEDAQSRVCVLQHAVEVRAAHTLSPVHVGAGEQLLFTQDTVGSVRTALPQADAWTRSMLVVNDWRLQDLIAELQRYRPGYLRCSEKVANLSISGVFHLQDIDAVLENLTSTLPVRIRAFTPYWTRVEPA
ncbi:FecR domain-containing protein [Pseudomonas sp. S75]|uniref:FecR domain-containing protein n=1 Tax=unclassified Pseudomonas TaxID=196821 RepID=UPI001907E483|nr:MULTISPECIES: FecR domain-containing protein [unclassified Pseudomonas]MBJ9976246.1 FecR domain-containing protein [Pseudomonas sp. S30]MBK0155767.1 FecR domain-containing protein [Pseudomonas sp. S75]